MIRLYLLSLLIVLSSSSPVYPLQSLSVRGRLQCGQFPLVGAKIKLIDIDTADKDDLLDVTVTDENGHFQLNGATREEDIMQGAIKIYHNCGDRFRLHGSDKKKLCARKVQWKIPTDYNADSSSTRWFDIGVINMELGFNVEERDCRH